MLSALLLATALGPCVASAPEWRFGAAPGMGWSSALGATADAALFGEGRIDDVRARVDVLGTQALTGGGWLVDGSLSAGLARAFVLDGARPERGVLDVALSVGPSLALLRHDKRERPAPDGRAPLEALDALDAASGATLALDVTLASIPVASLHARLRCTGLYAVAQREPLVTTSLTFGAALRDEALARVLR